MFEVTTAAAAAADEFIIVHIACALALACCGKQTKAKFYYLILFTFITRN